MFHEFYYDSLTLRKAKDRPYTLCVGGLNLLSERQRNFNLYVNGMLGR